MYQNIPSTPSIYSYYSFRCMIVCVCARAHTRARALMYVCVCRPEEGIQYPALTLSAHSLDTVSLAGLELLVLTKPMSSQIHLSAPNTEIARHG